MKPPELIIYTPVRGYFDMVPAVLAAVDAYTPAPFLHLIGDDFSPKGHLEKWLKHAGPIEREGKVVGERRIFRLAGLGAKGPPNKTLGERHAFRMARRTKDCRALLLLAYNSILGPETIEAFRRIQRNYPARHLGAIAPIYVKSNGCVCSFGGMTDRSVLGLHMGQQTRKLARAKPRHDRLDWAHSACLWLPRPVFNDRRIWPDVKLRLYYSDHDICFQIKDTGRHLLVASRAIVERRDRGASVKLLLGGEGQRRRANRKAKEQLDRKWSGGHGHSH